MIKESNPLKQQTQQFVEELKTGSNAILVAIRVRPLNSKQQSISSFQTVRVLDDKVLALMDPGTQFMLSTDVLRKNRNKQTQYAFDYVFDQHISNKEVYDKSVTFVLDGIMQGYHATIMAYGPTGCGKTHTMIGNGQQPGILPLSMIDLLSRISEQKKKWKDVHAKVSYLQIYNENLKDLLISEDKNFQLRQDPKEGIVIPGITQVTISNLNQLITVLKVGNRNRSKQSTKANQVSSRSHAILQVTVQIRQRAQTTIQQTILSKLSLVDLAGSQRAANTTNKGLRMVEGAKINQSLLMLGNCIQALSQACQKGLKKVFIPYRGSKLTRLLKDSLGGNCRTILIVCISPFIQTFQDTYNTLLYANRAKNIKNNAIRNVLNVETHFSNYVQIISTLKKQNQQLKQQIATSPTKQLLTQKNTHFVNLPKSSAYHSQMEKFEIWIQSQFKQEKTILQKIYQSQQKIQKAAFALFKYEISKNQTQVRKDQSKTQKFMAKNTVKSKKKQQESEQSEYRVNQILIQQLSITKQQLKQQLQKKQDNRSYLVNQIKKNDIIGQAGQPYLMALYKERKAQLQTFVIAQKQKLYDYEKKQKDLLLKEMKSQLQIREKIIEQQKVLIQKNNIIQRITYRKMNKIQNLEVRNHSLEIKKRQDNDQFDDVQPKKNKIKYSPKKSSKPAEFLAQDEIMNRVFDDDVKRPYKKSKFHKQPQIEYPEKKYYFNLKNKDERRAQQYLSSQNIRNNKKIGLSNQKQLQKEEEEVLRKNSSKKHRIGKIKSNRVFDVVMMHR